MFRGRILRKGFDALWEVLSKLSWEELKPIADDVVDVFEDHLTRMGDLVLARAGLAAIALVRSALNLPDDIDGDED